MADGVKRPYAKIGVNTSILPCELTIADEMSGDTEMRVLTFQADRWDTLLQVMEVTFRELELCIADVKIEKEKALEA